MEVIQIMPPDKTLLITTVDNPYSPFTEFTRWLFEDIRLGYNTCGLLSRLAVVSDTIADDGDVTAMRDVVRLDPYGKHVLVSRDDYDPHLNLPTVVVD